MVAMVENRSRAALKADLVDFLALVEQYDQAKEYDARYLAVMGAVTCALAGGLAAGIRIDPDELEWPVVYIELPTGQVSWHMPQHPIEWDGHDTAEKYRRCREYAETR